MKVGVKNWTGKYVEMELERALTPDPYTGYGSGELENMQSKLNAVCETVGKLLAYMVEQKTLSLTEAASIAGVAHDITSVT
jgi:hypothetical protein